MKKTSIRASDKVVGIKTFHGLKKQDDSGGFDLEEVNEKTKFLDQISQARFISQKEFLAKIRATFNPLRLLQSERKTTAKVEPKNSTWREGFDAIWVFEINNRKYEQIENPLNLGVFDSSKCYYIVFRKGNKVSIVLWRGKDQTLLSF